MELDMHDKLALSVEQAADAAPVGRTKLYEAIRDGRLKTRKSGRRTVILIDDFKQFLNSLPPRIVKRDGEAV
jgi:excisionase family DNA binding protein